MRNRLRTLREEVRLVGGKGLKRAPMIVVLMLISAMLDLAGVALIAPFLGLIVGNTAVLRWLPPEIIAAMGDDPLVFLGLALIILFAVKALATFVLQGAISRMSESIRADLMTRLLSAYQHRPYAWFLNQNSGDLVNRVNWHTHAFSTGFVGAGLRLGADTMVFMALGALILYANWMAFLLQMILLGAVFIVVHSVVRKRSTAHLQAQGRLNGEVVQSVNQAMGGLREIRMIGCEDYFLARMSRAAFGLVDSVTKTTVLNLVPRHAIEFVMVVFLVSLVFITRASEISSAELFPLLGVIGASAVRLMPAGTSLLTNFNSMRAYRFVVSILAQELADVSKDASTAKGSGKANTTTLGEFKEIRTEKLKFTHQGSQSAVFTDLDFRITAGETVGLMGPSGAGKSTLADLILGLLTPDGGSVLVNGFPLSEVRRDWQSRVAYIPQTPYMLDDSLRRNVALGVAESQIDDDKVLAALNDARLDQFLSSLPEGLDTNLGERGIRMSGGQRQRVSIARAIYHDREFLVFDEATSALDVETEQEVIETIRALTGRKTMLIIAHRDSTLACCTRLERLGPRAIENQLAVEGNAN